MKLTNSQLKSLIKEELENFDYNDSMWRSWVKFVERNPDHRDLMLLLWDAMITGASFREINSMAEDGLGYAVERGSFPSLRGPKMPRRGTEEEYLFSILAGIKFHARKIKPGVEYPTSEDLVAELEARAEKRKAAAAERAKNPPLPRRKLPYGGGSRYRPWDRST